MPPTNQNMETDAVFCQRCTVSWQTDQDSKKYWDICALLTKAAGAVVSYQFGAKSTTKDSREREPVSARRERQWTESGKVGIIIVGADAQDPRVRTVGCGARWPATRDIPVYPGS